jgi:hypothetical protein
MRVALGVVLAAMLVAAPARATIARVVPIAIDASSGGFTLRYLPAGGVDAGCASVALRPASSGRLEESATFRGADGTLVLHLVAWRLPGNRMSGRWWLAASTGAYSGRAGRGAFSARSSLTLARYRGVLVIAE